MKRVFIFIGMLLLIGSTVFGQQIRISGTVTDEAQGFSMPGVTVRVQGTTIGTATDANGRYEITAAPDAVLVFSFIGMQTKEVAVEGREIINVALVSEVIGLEEVMVVAYGTARRESFTGSATSVRTERLEEIQVTNITKALEGLSSGLTATSGSGQPGTTASLRIRGLGSVYASSEPLIVVDGFPYGGDLNAIPASDIESITVLKDASATALYGSRAANGVIIVTTKRGDRDRTEFNVRGTVGFSDRGIPEYDRVSINEYYELMWERLYNTNNNNAEAASMSLIPTLGNYNVYDIPNEEVVGIDGVISPLATPGNRLWTDDWYDEMHRTAIRQDYLVSASGGSETTNYYISGSYLRDDGIVTASNFNRFAIRANAQSQMRDWLNVGMNISGSTSEQNFPVSAGTAYVNSFMFSRNIGPIYPVYLYDMEGNIQLDAEGNKIYDYGSGFGRSRPYGSNVNPLGTIALDTRLYRDDVVGARGSVEADFLNDFKFTVSGSLDYVGYTGMTHQNAAFGDAAPFDGRSTRTHNRTLTFSANQLLTWGRSFDDHSVDVLLGHETYQWQRNILTGTRTGFPFPGLVELAAASTFEGLNSYEDNVRMQSVLSRVNYNFANRYYFSTSWRTDGSSRFHRDHRWGNFWSVGASWRLSEEAFMEDLMWLDNLSLRASYGSSGNDQVGFYAYPGLYGLGFANLDFPGLLATRLPTPNLTWEKNNVMNFGIDFTVFNRMTMNFEYYIRESEDLLFPLPLPSSTGFPSIDANVGAVENRGFDVEINSNIIATRNFRWDVDLNLTHYRNEITSLPQEEIVRGSHKWMVGRSIYDFFIEEFAGVDPETGKSMWYMDVLDDDGEPTGEREPTTNRDLAGRYYVGSSIPDLSGGLNNSFAMGNFDVSFLLTFGIGGKTYDGSYVRLMHGGTAGDHFHKDILNRWNEDNTDTDVPILDLDQNANARSTRFLFDSDYLSIRSLTIGYSVPQTALGTIGITRARVFATATNLYTFTTHKGMDPQQALSGITGDQYTPLRTIAFGVNMNF